MCSINDITLDRLIHTIGSFSQGAAGNSRFKKLCLKFNSCHVSSLDRFPVDYLDITGGQSLRKVVHGTGCLICIGSGNGSNIRHTLNSHYCILKTDTRVGKFTNIGGHILERVNSLIRVCIQFLEVLINFFKRGTGTHHDGLNRPHLQLVFLKTLTDRFNCQGVEHLFAGIYNRVGDVCKGGYSHDLQCRESSLYCFNRRAKPRHIDFLSSTVNAFKTFCSAVHIQTFL